MKHSMFTRHLFSIIGVATFILLTTSTSQAHKVNLDVYAKEGMVYVECYYPDGRKVESGCKIEVFDSMDSKLLEGAVNSEGMFSFKIPQNDDLKIVLDAKLGHKTSTYIFKEELEAGAVKKAQEHTHAGDSGQDHVHEKVRAKTNRVKKDPLPVASILGGLGFIFGLTALIMQLTGKKKG